MEPAPQPNSESTAANEHGQSPSEASPDSLLVVDGDGVIEQVGGNLSRMLGRAPESLVGRSIAEVLAPSSAKRLLGRLPELLTLGPEAPAVVLEKISGIGGDGERFDAEAVLVVLQPEGDEPEHILVTLRDDRRSAVRRDEERQVRERLASSNRDLEAFAAVAAHDLQEPLRKIQVFSDRTRMAMIDGQSERAGTDLDRIEAAAVRMQELIDDLLVLARVSGQAPNPETVDLTALCQGLAERLASAEPSHGAVEIDLLPRVHADPVRMEQLFYNLISNGLKFHREDVPPSVMVAGHESDKFATITVTDNGIGFDDRHAERIFRPFERLHGRAEYDGSGVGLALCKSIVERHGGTLTAQGRPGDGATFTLTLPAAEE